MNLFICILVGILLGLIFFLWDPNRSKTQADPIKGMAALIKETEEIKKQFEFDCLKEQVDHLATVQMLMLKDMKKEHQIQPAKDVLVTISDLPELKNKRERSA